MNNPKLTFMNNPCETYLAYQIIRYANIWVRELIFGIPVVYVYMSLVKLEITQAIYT